jgi:hypothetical protein
VHRLMKALGSRDLKEGDPAEVSFPVSIALLAVSKASALRYYRFLL